MGFPVIGPDANGNYWQQYIDVSGGPGQEVLAFRQTIAPAEPPGTNFVSNYTYNDALQFAQLMAKGVPLVGKELLICNMASTAIYKSYPWRDTLVVIPDGTYPLVDKQQDYGLGALTMMRPTQFWLMRNDVTPKVVRQIDVANNLYLDPQPKSAYSIRCASLQGGIMKLRLESAVSVPTGTSWELGGEYQPHPTKVNDLAQPLWFADEHIEVLAKGIAYWTLKFAERSDATEALLLFQQAIKDMAATEDFGNLDGYYPDDSIGTVDARRTYGYDFLGR